jgi:hypothetical protein
MQLFIPFVELEFPSRWRVPGLRADYGHGGTGYSSGGWYGDVPALYVQRPKTLETRWDDSAALILIALIPLFGYMMEGFRIVASSPPWAAWSPVGSAVAALMSFFGLSAAQAAVIHSYNFWTHAAMGLLLIAAIPFTKMRHLVTTPLNVIFRSRRETGELEMIANIEETEILGVGKSSPNSNLTNFCLSTPASAAGAAKKPARPPQAGCPILRSEFIQSLRTAMNSAFLGIER